MDAMSRLLACFVFLLMIAGSADFASAQEGPGGAINPGRDCHTILTCQFKKGGSWRGCLSSYSCRTCRLVTANCTIGGKGRVCQRVTCGWAGA
jgi:hypothetical protein